MRGRAADDVPAPTRQALARVRRSARAADVIAANAARPPNKTPGVATFAGCRCATSSPGGRGLHDRLFVHPSWRRVPSRRGGAFGRIDEELSPRVEAFVDGRDARIAVGAQPAARQDAKAHPSAGVEVALIERARARIAFACAGDSRFELTGCEDLLVTPAEAAVEGGVVRDALKAHVLQDATDPGGGAGVVAWSVDAVADRRDLCRVHGVGHRRADRRRNVRDKGHDDRLRRRHSKATTPAPPPGPSHLGERGPSMRPERHRLRRLLQRG